MEPFHGGGSEKREDPLWRGGCDDAEMWPCIPVPALELAAAQLPSPAPHRSVIYSHLFLKLFWESVKTEPGTGATLCGVFLLKAGFSTGQFWDMPRLVAGAEGHICTWLLQKQTFPSLPSLPLPLQDSEKQLEGTGWWERQQDPQVDPRKRRGLGHQLGQGWDICEVQTRIDSSPGFSPYRGFPTRQLPSLHAPGLWFRSYIHIPALFSHFSGSLCSSVETLQGSAWVGNCSSGQGGSFLRKEGVGFWVCSRFCCC